MRLLIKEINLIILIICLNSACSRMEQAESERMKKLRAQKECIYRNHEEKQYTLTSLQVKARSPYPWEQMNQGKYPRITKEYFRCKGSSLNPPHLEGKDSAQAAVVDCSGFQRHSLPVCEGKEFVYPILLDLLNYIQEQTNHQVIVTCGHRCPTHNTYADTSAFNRSSKHQIGAEVDFYVKGMEEQPETIIELLKNYYRDQERAYKMFDRLAAESGHVSTPLWANKEIVIKLYTKDEGRDLDNRHPYPYIGIQVRFDKKKQERVIYDWNTAFKGYQRY